MSKAIRSSPRLAPIPRLGLFSHHLRICSGSGFRRVLPCLLLFWRSVVLLCLVVRGRRSSQTRPGLVLLVRCGWLWVVSQCSLSEPPNRTARPPTPLGPGVLL